MFSLLNVGGRAARRVATEWQIIDNDHPIASPSFREHDIEPERALVLQYTPDISAAGRGTFRLILTITYIDSTTNEKVVQRYDGFTDYVVREGQSKRYLLTPSE